MHNGEIATSIRMMLLLLLMDCGVTACGVIDIQCFSIRVIRLRLTLAIKMNGLTLRCLMALSRSARNAGVLSGHKWIGCTLFVLLDRPTADKNAEQQTDDKCREAENVEDSR